MRRTIAANACSGWAQLVVTAERHEPVSKEQPSSPADEVSLERLGVPVDDGGLS